jgi:hypothetical protein
LGLNGENAGLTKRKVLAMWKVLKRSSWTN